MNRRLRRRFAFALAFILLASVWTEARTNAPSRGRKATPASGLKTPIDRDSSGLPRIGDGGIVAIEVKGQRKIEKDAILARLQSAIGEPVSAAKIREDIQSIFRLGYFYDVKVSQEPMGAGVKLVYEVVERQTIGELVFVGNDEVKTDDLKEQVGIKAFEILDRAKVREAVEKLEKFYEEKGFFLARIVPVIEDLDPGVSVRMKFEIVERDKVKVRKIHFIGNNKLGDDFLKTRMKTQEGGFFSFISGSGGFAQDAFDMDVQRLRMIYLNEGYVQAKIDRPQVTISPDKKDIQISIRIEEGEQFDVGEMEFTGDLLFSRDELMEAISTRSGETFNYGKLMEDVNKLTAKYGDLGYAFTNVIPRTNVIAGTRKVQINFEFDKGNKVYFGRFIVTGNSKTRDKVVRRELRILEGELYNETRRRKSLENIQRLGFFEEVNFRSSTTPEAPDILNIEIAVKERTTGTVQLSAGYGAGTGFTLSGQVNQSNFAGRGQNLGAGLTYSQNQLIYSFRFSEPNVNDSDWSAGFEAYQQQSDRFDYRELRVGGALRMGHPVAENTDFSVRYRFERISMSRTFGIDGGAEFKITDETLFPVDRDSGNAGSLATILEYDTRNDRMAPSAGTYASASLEAVGVGGDLRYGRAGVSARYYKNLFWEVVWRNNVSYTYLGTLLTGSEQPPFNERLLLGGPYSLRGYRFLRVGKTAFSQQTYNQLINSSNPRSAEDARRLAQKPVGGSQMALYQMEFEFPVIREAGIKGVGFYDIGQAEDQLTPNDFYSNVGFGFRWYSPIGVLRFEWGFPLRRTELSPDPVVFEFSIGSPF